MDRDEAVARIQRGLGWREDLVDEIVAALKEARRNLEMGKSLPNFLLQETQSLVLPAGSANVALPDGFIREFQEEGLWLVQAAEPDNIIWLEKLDFNIGNSRFANSDPGTPQAYTLRRNSIKFWPTRDVAYTLTWSYYKKSVDLSSNVDDNEWLDEDEGAPEVLIGRAGTIIAGDLQDQASLQKFAAMYSAASAAMFGEDQLNDEENRPLSVGSRL